jgi:hypothetical protein
MSGGCTNLVAACRAGVTSSAISPQYAFSYFIPAGQVAPIHLAVPE